MNRTSDPSGQTPFIPARESPAFTALFGLYVKLLARLRFRRAWIACRYRPEPGKRTVYFLNHSSWWDGLLPLLLNRERFGQNARAMMEDRQMVRFPFFSRIGAFSVSLTDKRHAARSLRYALESMRRPDACLFLYPEGQLVPFSSRKPEFRPGIVWLARRLPQVDLVPVAVHIHTFGGSRPDLQVLVGEPARVGKLREEEPGITGSEMCLELERSLQRLLVEAERTTGKEEESGLYERWF